MNSRLHGVPVLVTLVAVFALLSGEAASQSTPDQKSEDSQRTFTLDPGGTLSVDNYKGTIHVTGSQGNQVVVAVHKRFDGSDSDRKWWMENTEVNFHNDSHRVEVEVKYPTWTCIFCWEHSTDAAVELEIKVPQRTNVRLDSYKPDIRISSIEGDIRIKSYKSPISIESTTGAIRVDTYKDVIRLRDVNLRSALEVKSYKADAEIIARSLGDSADIETSKGSITLRVPANAGFEVDFSGGRRAMFHSEFPLTTQTGSRWDREVHGTVNNGGSHVRLRSERGRVSLEKTNF